MKGYTTNEFLRLIRQYKGCSIWVAFPAPPGNNVVMEVSLTSLLTSLTIENKLIVQAEIDQESQHIIIHSMQAIA